ncbi:MAG: protein kinase [Candidatus Aminicenantes bacterium]|jgi:serine/threonine protein kinase
MTIECPKCHFENTDDSIYCGKCTTPLKTSDDAPIEHTETLQAPKEDLTSGSTFAGRYQIIEELGKGGMGWVYRAMDKKLSEEVALKLIKPEIASDKKTVQRFSNELKIARKIAHKNVGKMYDLNEEDGTHYITMEYVPGQDLKGLIRQSKQLTVGTAISITQQICDGLSEAHSLGVVHRDLKPSNIMIDKNGNARIMDFGIARSVEGKGLTGAGIMIGTPEYMAPEQVEGKEVDARTDIYSLGIILYEMLTGRVPFEGDTALSVAVKHKTEMPKAPTEYNERIPEDLNRLILRCLEKDKEKRYQSVDELSPELADIEKGVPTAERVMPERTPLTSREITVKFSLKRLLLPGAVVIAVIIVALLIWKVLPRKGRGPLPAGKPSLAVMYFENNTGEEGLDHWRKALSDLLISDLTQSKYIKVLSSDKLFSILRKLDLLEARSYGTEDLQEVAFEGKASHLLQGVLTKAGDNFRINITIQEASTGELIGSETAEGRGQESFHLMVDELTPKIKTNFELNDEDIAGDIDKDIGKIMTKSPEAYKYYVEGRKYHKPGSYDLELEFMEKAVDIDPEFAMAYRAMAAVHRNWRDYPEARKYLDKALEFSDRLPVRDQYLIEGDSHSIDNNFEKAVEAYSKLLELYPDDYTGLNNMGVLYAARDDWDNAIKYYELAYTSEKGFLGLTNLADHYEKKGLYDKSRELYIDYLKNVSSDVQIHWRLAFNYAVGLEFDLALDEMDKVIALNPRANKDWLNFLKGDFDLFEKACLDRLKEEDKRSHLGARRQLDMLYRTRGKFEEAKKQNELMIELAKELEMPGRIKWIRLSLSYNYLLTEEPQKALREIDLAMEEVKEEENRNLKIWALPIRAIALSKMESFDEAEKVAESLKLVIEEGIKKKEIRSYYLVRGMIELERGNTAEAVKLLEEAVSLMPAQNVNNADQAWYIYPLASAYYADRNLDRAREEFENITLLTVGRQGYGELYAKSFYMLGKIYDEKGNSLKAKENYEKFLDLWKDADPGLSEVEDAKKKLAAL